MINAATTSALSANVKHSTAPKMSQTYTTDFVLCPAGSTRRTYIDPKAKTSLFTRAKTRELSYKERLYGFVNNRMGISFRNNARYKCVPYKSELNMMEAYLGIIDKSTGYAATIWSLPSHGWGRIQPEHHLSLSVMHRPTRHALCEGIYLDFDIENCHPAFLLDMLRRDPTQDPQSYDSLATYVADPKAVRAQIMEHYGVDKEAAKRLPIRLMNGGCIKSWKLDYEVSLKTDLPIMVKLEKELKPIIEEVWIENQQIHIDLFNMKTDAPKSEQYAHKSLSAKKRTVMATWAQTIERCIQERAISAIVKEYNIPLEDTVPCQDGFMIPVCYDP
jgi:hypothetical protein